MSSESENLEEISESENNMDEEVAQQEAEEAMAYVMECMRFVPSWADGIPLNCEAGIGESYGDC